MGNFSIRNAKSITGSLAKWVKRSGSSKHKGRRVSKSMSENLQTPSASDIKSRTGSARRLRTGYGSAQKQRYGPGWTRAEVNVGKAPSIVRAGWLRLKAAGRRILVIVSKMARGAFLHRPSKSHKTKRRSHRRLKRRSVSVTRQRHIDSIVKKYERPKPPRATQK